MANRYIRIGAVNNGDGTSWSEAPSPGAAGAFNAIPAALVRGNTYYLSDGTYGTYSCDDAISGTQAIALKKATITDHGSEIGWLDLLGDGQAVFEKITITSNYWVIDGTSRTDWSSGHGIKVKRTTNSDKAIVSTGTDNITFKYVEVEYLGTTGTRDDGIYANGGCNNYIVQYCYLHDICSNGILIHGTNNLIEHTLFARIQSQEGSAIHGQAIQMFYNGTQNMEIRYCRFEDIGGTASIAMAWGTDRVTIHGNIFYYTAGFLGTGTSPGQIVEISDPIEIGLSNAQIYNNTFSNQPSGNSGIRIYLQASETNHAYNNLWYNCAASPSLLGMSSHTYNTFHETILAYGSVADPTEEFLSGNPFTDSATNDYTLKIATTAGKAIDGGTSYDMFGNIRGLDGIIDRGALEFVGRKFKHIGRHIKLRTFSRINQ